MKQDDFDQLTTTIVAYLEQHLQSHLQCPKCSHDQIHRWGTLKGLQRYRLPWLPYNVHGPNRFAAGPPA